MRGLRHVPGRRVLFFTLPPRLGISVTTTRIDSVYAPRPALRVQAQHSGSTDRGRLWIHSRPGPREARRPVTLERNNVPRLSMRCGEARCISRKGARRLISSMASQASSFGPRWFRSRYRPAALTSTSILPKRSRGGHDFVISVSCDTSATTPRNCGSGQAICFSSSTKDDSFLPTPTTLAPASAKRSAAAFPIPEVAPVINRVCLQNLCPCSFPSQVNYYRTERGARVRPFVMQTVSLKSRWHSTRTQLTVCVTKNQTAC